MTTAPPPIERLQSIRTFSELIEYLRDELDWPVTEDMTEDEAFFAYDAEEIGLDEASAVKINKIRRLRPLVAGQPWGIFFIEFRPGKLPITVLRRILRALVLKRRAGNDRQRWQMGDLLFVSILGESQQRKINLAHFSDDGSGDGRAALRVVDWDEDDAHFHMLRTAEELHRLRWPDDPKDLEAWRDTWSGAFRLKPGQVAKTAAQLATQMAGLAKLIRSRVNAAMDIEAADGPLRRIYQAFKETLVSDLTEDDFADMYAQTITYGLFAARRSRSAGIIPENARDMVPNTNPFLRDLLAEFTDVGGVTKSLDFDELGIDALIEVLNQADMEAVVADFDDKNPNEDPVIHFYEDFLRQYDKKMKIQRGIFFTPRPVVSFIVRSVDELLRTEFGLKDGLADTTTWGEMVKRNPDLVLPQGATPETPFVQILDPAVGTGTFLVEVIDVIHRTMMAKWQREGHLPMLDTPKLWNDYVAKHLLPRLYGFELMMAPYAIAHMKIGLKLEATGYGFGSSERARVFLTNSLEPATDEVQTTLAGMFPALALEAATVSSVKRHQRFTVVVGNPPYSNFGRLNRTPFILGLLDDYKRDLAERKINLDDDFIKFLRYSQHLIDRAGFGVIGVITNNTYLDGITHRRMRQSLRESHTRTLILDLHGSMMKGDRTPTGQPDDNVFDIKQGVSIALLTRCSRGNASSVQHCELWGDHESKYSSLSASQPSTMSWRTIDCEPPDYLFVPTGATGTDEYSFWPSITDLFSTFVSGIQTGRDSFVSSVSIAEFNERLALLSDNSISDKAIAGRYHLPNFSGFNLTACRNALRKRPRDVVAEWLYRPFDIRPLLFHPSVIKRMRGDLMNSLRLENIALISVRQLAKPGFAHIFTTTRMGDGNTISLKTREYNYYFPLYTYGQLTEAYGRTHNLDRTTTERLASAIGMRMAADDVGDVQDCIGPCDVFGYTYAVLHSPSYRSRYESSLKRDFPRVPVTNVAGLFRTLSALGQELISLHIMDSAALQETTTAYVGVGEPIVEDVSYASGRISTNRARTCGFDGVPAEVWSFHIGGYQVCEKWLKDRKGRILSEEDIAHYQKIVVAISETIRIMRGIDEVIEKYGGWPGAFVTGEG